MGMPSFWLQVGAAEGERRDDAAVEVGDVVAAASQDRLGLAEGPRREGHVEGQEGLAEAVDLDAVDDGGPGEGRHHLHVVTGRDQLAPQLVDLHLDAPEAGT